MNKTVVIATLILLVAVLSSCGEKHVLGKMHGVWRLNKYVVNNQDKTAEFKERKPNFGWSFDEDNVFSQWWNMEYDSTVITVDSIFDTDTVFVRTDTTWGTVPAIGIEGITGTWQLINGNRYLQTRDDSTGVNQYKIVESKAASLHLFKGNENFYLTQD